MTEVLHSGQINRKCTAHKAAQGLNLFLSVSGMKGQRLCGVRTLALSL